jgi:hypothetical protein
MARRYDPLAQIPSPEPVRRRLAETEELARRLRVLLELSERVHSTPHKKTADRREAARG